MAEFIPQARDRLDQPIVSSIEAKNFKQALKQVEKRLGKTRDPWLLAVRILIQCRHAAVVEKASGLSALYTLLYSQQHVTELSSFGLDGLEILDECAKSLSLSLSSRGALEYILHSMRTGAVKGRPKDEELGITCFGACIKQGDFEGAQEIANSLFKNFPSNRAYHFWLIVSSALIPIPMSPEGESKSLFIKLAWERIKRLAMATSQAHGKSPPPPQSLQTSQEIRLMHTIAGRLSKDDERLKFYSDDSLGPASKAAQGDWAIRRDYLVVLLANKLWQNVFDDCDTLLTNARANNSLGQVIDSRGADWLVWKSYILAATKLQNKTASELVQRQLKAHIDPKSGLDKVNRRNAALAMLELTFQPSHDILLWELGRVWKDDSNAIEGISPRVTQLVLYLHRYGGTVSAFTDVKGYVEALELGEQKKLILLVRNILVHLTPITLVPDGLGSFEECHLIKLNLSSSEMIIAGLTVGKLEYLIFNSLPGVHGKLRSRWRKVVPRTCLWCSTAFKYVCEACLMQQALRAVINYENAVDDDGRMSETLLPTDKHPADDWAIIAAMCLMKLYWICERDNETFYADLGTYRLLQAAAILEFAYNRSKANPHISILLVRLYSELGAGSLAIRSYNRLGLKQIQQDTLGFILFDRISSLHPHEVVDSVNGAGEMLSPSAYLSNLQSFYKSSKKHISANTWKAVEQGNYEQIFGVLQVSSRLSGSLAAIMSVIEVRRMNRLTLLEGSSAPESYEVPSPVSNWYDNFDYGSFPNYESSRDGDSFESLTRLAPGPSVERIRVMTLIESLWTLTNTLKQTDTQKRAALVDFKSFALCVAAELTQKSLERTFLDHFTAAEAIRTRVAIALTQLVSQACFSKASTSSASRQIIDVSCYLARNAVTDLREQILLIPILDDAYVPLFPTTLHPLYVANDTATLVIAVCEFVFSPSVQQQWKCDGDSFELQNSAKDLQQCAASQGKQVRKRLNSGQWMDFILGAIENESAVEEVRRVEAAQENNVSGPHIDSSVGKSMMSVLGQDFLEQFTGELVDSWRESVIGLACLKTG